MLHCFGDEVERANLMPRLGEFGAIPPPMWPRPMNAIFAMA
jgi:hypothetical protein